MPTGTLNWNGQDIPDELRILPAGTYVVESVEQVPLLTIGRTLDWNGRNLPDEFRALPAGTYVVEPDHVPVLTEDDEVGLNAAFDSLDAGGGRTLAQVRETIAAIVAVRRRR